MNWKKLKMTVEKMEKASTARMDCLKKEGWRWGHVSWRRGKETRVANGTRNFGAELGKATIAALAGRDEQKC